MSDTPVTAPAAATTPTLFSGLKDLLTKAEDDYTKARGGNIAAGTRFRGVMQEVRVAAKGLRDEMLTLREKARAEKPAKAPKAAKPAKK